MNPSPRILNFITAGSNDGVPRHQSIRMIVEIGVPRGRPTPVNERRRSTPFQIAGVGILVRPCLDLPP